MEFNEPTNTKINNELERSTLRQRRNALTHSEMTDLCLFSLKYQLSHSQNGDGANLSEFVELVNRYTFDGSLPMCLNTLIECAINKKYSDNEENMTELIVRFITLLDIMQEYKNKSSEEFYSSMCVVDLYSFLTGADVGNSLLV